MKKLYLVDLFNPTLNNSAVIDVLTPSTGQVNMGGCFVYPVDASLALTTEPTTYGNVVGYTNAAQTAANPSLNRRISHAFQTPDVDATNSSGVYIRPRGGITIQAAVGMSTGTYQSTEYDLGGFTPTSIKILFDIYKITVSPVDNFGLSSRTYVDLDNAYAMFQVSFNSGATWVTCTHNTTVSISAPDQGTHLIAKVTNIYGNTICLSNWTALYA